MIALGKRALGFLDEYLISRLIARGREAVWHHAVGLLEVWGPDERARLIRRVEDDAVRLCHALAP